MCFINEYHVLILKGKHRWIDIASILKIDIPFIDSILKWHLNVMYTLSVLLFIFLVEQIQTSNLFNTAMFMLYADW